MCHFMYNSIFSHCLLPWQARLKYGTGELFHCHDVISVAVHPRVLDLQLHPDQVRRKGISRVGPTHGLGHGSNCSRLYTDSGDLRVPERDQLLPGKSKVPRRVGVTGLHDRFVAILRGAR